MTHTAAPDGGRLIVLTAPLTGTIDHAGYSLQWQLIMKCWKMNLRPGQTAWWAPTAWRMGALGLWAAKLRTLNGPGFTWPLFMFASAAPERLMAQLGKLYAGQPLTVKSRKELLATIKPHQRRHLRADAGALPDEFTGPSTPHKRIAISLTPRRVA